MLLRRRHCLAGHHHQGDTQELECERPVLFASTWPPHSPLQNSLGLSRPTAVAWVPTHGLRSVRPDPSIPTASTAPLSSISPPSSVGQPPPRATSPTPGMTSAAPEAPLIVAFADGSMLVFAIEGEEHTFKVRTTPNDPVKSDTSYPVCLTMF